MQKKKKLNTAGTMSHPNLIPRVNEFLKSRKNFYASTTVIVEHLRAQYPEYSRLAINKLQVPIDNYLTSESYSRNRSKWLEFTQDGNVSESESDPDDDKAGLVELPDTNSLNSSLRSTYLKSSSQSQNASDFDEYTEDLNQATSSSTVTPPTPTPASNTSTSTTPSRSKVLIPRSKKRSRDEATPGPTDENMNNPSKKQASSSSKNRPTVRYSDLGGIESVMQDVRELIERPLTHPEIYEWLGTQLPRGVLLHGPPGCGKTQLANAIAGELGISFFQISAPEIVSGMSGESEAKIRSLFQDAKAKAPSILFIDEIDAITPKRENAAREMERRIVAQLLTCMDDMEGGLPVMVIGATNRPDALDQALRRSGRFDREICLNVPDQAARTRILKVIASKLRLSGDFDFDLIASNTPGYVGADLQSIAKEAASIAVNRIFSTIETRGIESLKQQIPSSSEANPDMEVDHNPGAPPSTEHHQSTENRQNVSDLLRNTVEPFSPEQLAPLSITMGDFMEAIKRVQPSAKREGFATIPNVTWEDIGALVGIRKELEMALLEPIRSRTIYDALNIPVSLGVLLYGPPGCGKTLLAKAVANQAQANFISIKGPELLNKFVGESERAVRVVFQRARASAPCIIFFDEIDALVPRRVGGENAVTERVVNQLLIELDGLEQRHGISVVAATNRPDIIDPAMLRPGRLDKLLYVPLPTPEERYHILKTCARKTPLSSDVDLMQIANDHRCTGYSGADIASLVREASMNALEQALDMGSKEIPVVSKSNFQIALRKVNPSVSKVDQLRYERLRNKLSSPHLLIDKDEESEAKNQQQPAPTQ